MKNIIFKTETILAIAIVLMVIAIGIMNPSAWSLNTVFNMLRSAIVMGIFAILVMMVLITGNVDVSFTYFAAISAYMAVRLLVALNYTGSIIVPFLVAGLFGVLMGMVNGYFIAIKRLPALIVTLGTGTAFQGLVVFFVGGLNIINLPGQMLDFSKLNLVSIVTKSGAKGGINISILITIAVILIGGFLLRKTVWGRGLYAIGGSREAAHRVGYNVQKIEFSLYCLVGILSGIAGIIFMSINRQANPHLMVGSELDVIAAVVLGGTSITGGRGSVLGTVLGVTLLVIIKNSLILIGVPSQWQNVVTGLVILIGTVLPIIQTRLQNRNRDLTNNREERGLTNNQSEQ